MPVRHYPAVISHDQPDGPFGVVFPDFPGCVSQGDTVQAAAAAAAEALELHVEGMTEAGDPLPPPSAPSTSLPDWLAGAGGKTAACVLVPTDVPECDVPVNLTMDERLLARLDAAATAEGISRSSYIAQAVRQRLRSAAG